MTINMGLENHVMILVLGGERKRTKDFSLV
jgi:hypothetical protein